MTLYDLLPTHASPFKASPHLLRRTNHHRAPHGTREPDPNYPQAVHVHVNAE